MAHERPTQARVRELFNYDIETGELIRKIPVRGVKAGGIAGTICDSGHVQLHVDRRLYYAHQIVWLWWTGEWPARIDHEDANAANNRIDNLRLATWSQNNANKPRYKSNTSGYKGVSFYKAAGKYVARIHAAGKRCYLGVYTTAEEAHKAYCAAANVYFGEFARVA